MSSVAVLFDLGDVIMREETEEMVDDVTQRAELIPGMAHLLHDLHASGATLALAADTRTGTYLNVLRQHGLNDCFDVFASFEELGVRSQTRASFVSRSTGWRSRNPTGRASPWSATTSRAT